jgi:uncharacterized membrane protein YphA (DoxX/SURF4 family)
MKNKVQFVVCLLFGLMFINAGLNKFFNYLPVPKDLPEHMLKIMGAMMTIKWLMPLIATAEIIGGTLFIFKKYRALAAIIIFPVMVGIMLTHIIDAPSGLPIALYSL